jgi:hypothetical protein
MATGLRRVHGLAMSAAWKPAGGVSVGAGRCLTDQRVAAAKTPGVELGKSGYNYTEEFEFVLDLLLGGFERLRQQGCVVHQPTPAAGRQQVTAAAVASGPEHLPLRSW